ncbi:tRNA-guanine transglycosylase [Sistotremastrum niveocremeum HHB9708]|uniref:tRNA-guanine transglycosylase n=1 Tax=Sistotremastrum niveocremeum HHB9708 TaxID=1314777 RepID=A0A164ZN20_9AGAM|nr:tRNA-guanine transglycosylase [Sistotremastrum niveocremeum HHB9708]
MLSFRPHTNTIPEVFGPRRGLISFVRSESNDCIKLETPGLLVSTSRGVVPHLSRDNLRRTNVIRWINVPFESFLERQPPLPTTLPLQPLLGFDPSRHIIALSLRDPNDLRPIPPNGDGHVSAMCIRGVQRVSPSSYKTYVRDSKPDVVFALTDTCLSAPPHSQKRMTKSIDRSCDWLRNLLSSSTGAERSRNIFVNLAGGGSAGARRAFAARLVEPLEPKDLVDLHPLQSLDEGISGYSSDLASLRASVLLSSHDELSGLIKDSLGSLSNAKARIATGSRSPHECLRLIRDVGFDLFDAQWAVNAAHWGVALDFRFPVPSRLRDRESLDIGHNLYSEGYAEDFRSFIHPTEDVISLEESRCRCSACSPSFESDILNHSPSLDLSASHDTTAQPFTRAYLHHLLQTHEMSAHALLMMHNLTVADDFFAGVRSVLEAGPGNFNDEIALFEKVYDESMMVMATAKEAWGTVDKERGKGRLAREQQKAAKNDQQPVVQTESTPQ